MHCLGIYLLYIATFFSHLALATGNGQQVCHTNPGFSGYMVNECPDGWTIKKKQYVFRKHRLEGVQRRPRITESVIEGELEEADDEVEVEDKTRARKIHRILPKHGGNHQRSEINEGRKDTRKTTTVTNIVGGKHHKKKVRDNDGPVRGHVSTTYTMESDETEDYPKSIEEVYYSYEDESPEIQGKKVTKITKIGEGKNANKEGGKDSGDTRKHTTSTTTKTVVEGKLKGQKSHPRHSTSRRWQYAERDHVTPESDEELSYESTEDVHNVHRRAGKHHKKDAEISSPVVLTL